jgi:hypothetical protein
MAFAPHSPICSRKTGSPMLMEQRRARLYALRTCLPSGREANLKVCPTRPAAFSQWFLEFSGKPLVISGVKGISIKIEYGILKIDYEFNRRCTQIDTDSKNIRLSEYQLQTERIIAKCTIANDHCTLLTDN